MSKSNHDLDDLIREVLADEESEAFAGLEDQSAFELAAEVLRGRHRLFGMLAVVVSLVLFVIGVGAAIAFANAQDVRTMMLHAGTSALCFGGILAIKLWYWLEMNRLALTREVKRLELQIAELSRRTRDGERR
jgi:hypothetical protein